MPQKLSAVPMHKQVMILPYNDANDPLIGGLMDMGFIAGALVTPRHVGPFGRDPIAVEIEGSIVGIGRELASLIEVEAVP